MDNICKSCKFWNGPSGYHDGYEDAQCFRFPPVPVYDGNKREVVMLRPVVNGQADSCGEWKQGYL